MKKFYFQCLLLAIPFLIVLMFAQATLFVSIEFVLERAYTSCLVGIILHAVFFELLLLLYDYFRRSSIFGFMIYRFFRFYIGLYLFLLTIALIQNDTKSAWDMISRFVVVYAVLIIESTERKTKKRK